MKITHKNKYILLLPFLIATLGCSDLLENPSRQSNVLVPLAAGELKIQNALNDENKTTAADGSISLLYKHLLFENTISGTLEIGEATAQIQHSFTQNQTVNPGNFIFGQNQNAVFQSDNAYRTAEFESLTAEVTLQTDIARPVLYTVSLPGFTTENRPVKFELEHEGTTTRTITETLENVTADLTGIDKTQLNSAHVILTAQAGNNTLTISPGDEVNLQITLRQGELKFARGTFKPETQELASASGFEALKNFQSGKLTPGNATLQITVENFTGLNATLKFKNISSVKTTQNQKVSLIAGLTQNPINLTPASYNGSVPENPGRYSAQLTRQNSNIADFLEILPDAFEHRADIDINPRGNLSAANDFLHRDFGITTRGELNLPLNLAAENLVLTEKYTFDLKEDERETTDKINGGRLLLNTKNGYPLNAEIQGYFVNEAGDVIDSLFSEPQDVAAADTDEQTLRVTEVRRQQFEVLLTEQRIDNLYLSKEIAFKLRLNTPNPDNPVPFYDDYSMQLNFVGDLMYKLDLY